MTRPKSDLSWLGFGLATGFFRLFRRAPFPFDLSLPLETRRQVSSPKTREIPRGDMTAVRCRPAGLTASYTFLFFLAALSGCATQGPSAVTNSIPLRNPTAPVASQANIALSEITGSYDIVQAAGVPNSGQVTLTDRDLVIESAAQGWRWPFQYDGAGRFDTPEGPLWIFWADIGRRTLVIGDPNGTRVWIMNRDNQGLAERLTVGRGILEWYGFDLVQLTPAP